MSETKEHPLAKYLPRDWQKLVTPMVAIVIAVWSLFGVNGRVGALEERTERLVRKVQKVERLADRIHELGREVKDIAKARNDILRAIRRATK